MTAATQLDLLDLLDAAPADPWTDFKDVPAAAIRPLLTTRKEA